MTSMSGFYPIQCRRRPGQVLALAGDRCQVVVLTCTPDRFGAIPGARVIRLGAAEPVVANRIGHLTRP
jgi:hypothetical protein